MECDARIPLDHEALLGALRSLGLLYGARQPFHATVAGALNEADAVRAYLKRERPHLLLCYDIEALVAMVLAARESRPDAMPGVERFGPT